MEKMRQWSILTAVGVLAIIVAGWFLMVSPQRSHASDLRGQATQQQSDNDTLRAQVQQLEAQKKGLPAQQRLLDQIATKIPGDPQLPTLIRQLSTAADVAGVDLVTLAPSAPTLVAPPLAATSASAATSTTAAGPASGAASPLAQIPVAITVEGSYFNLNSFFSAVEKLKRAVLVTGWTITPKLQGAAGQPADAATPPDSLSATLSSIVFESPAAITPATTVPATSTAAK